MTEISSIALTDNNEAADYVSLFNWDNGANIVTLTPSALGHWTYTPPFNMTCGVTYVHRRAVPVTHGPYEILGKYGATITSGYLYMVYASSGGSYVKQYDKTATDEPNWKDNFEQVLDIGLLEYRHGNSSVTIENFKKVIDIFYFGWKLHIYGGNGTWYNDTHTWTFEILDSNDNVLAALKSQGDGTFRSGLWYGVNLQNMTKAPQTASYPYTSGDVTFTNNSIVHVSRNESTTNRSFIFNVDISQAAKIRLSGSAYSTYTSGGGAGGYIKIIKPDA